MRRRMGYIMNKRTGRRIRLQRVGGVYILKMRLKDEAVTGGSSDKPGSTRPRQ